MITYWASSYLHFHVLTTSNWLLYCLSLVVYWGMLDGFSCLCLSLDALVERLWSNWHAWVVCVFWNCLFCIICLLHVINLLNFSQKGAMSPMEVCEGLGLYDLRNRIWHIQGTCALKGDGLYEGLDWLASTLKELQASGRSTSVGTSFWLWRFTYLNVLTFHLPVHFLYPFHII